MENLVLQFIDSFNIEMESNKRFLIDKSRYKFQIIAVTNNKEQKIVWINAFCNDHNIDWRKNRIYVSDGGICYFKLLLSEINKK